VSHGEKHLVAPTPGSVAYDQMNAMGDLAHMYWHHCFEASRGVGYDQAQSSQDALLSVAAKFMSIGWLRPERSRDVLRSIGVILPEHERTEEEQADMFLDAIERGVMPK
jgi:hypothetical protein